VQAVVGPAGDAKVGEASILATMLYEDSQKQTDDAKRSAEVEEAKKTLADTAQQLPDQADALLLHDLACLSYETNDQPGAIAALQAALKKPDDGHAAERKAYLAYYLVRAGKNAEAEAAIQGLTPSADQPEIAYAIAWASWRSGDLPTARAGMLAAVTGWKNGGFVPAIKRDTLVFGARAGGSIDDAIALATAYVSLVKADPNMQGDKGMLAILIPMRQSFLFAGRLQDSVTLIDKIFDLVKSLKKSDIVNLRLLQADASRAIGDTKNLVAYAQQAADTLAACGANCDAKPADVAKLLFNMARYSNSLYVTSQDDRWYAAGSALYKLYLAVPGITDATQVGQEASTLEAAHAHAKKNAGTHDKTITQYVLQGYAQEIGGCYDQSLQLDPKLAGDLKLHLEVADSGQVTGATSDPAAGKDGLAAVGTCVTAAARTWNFPARTKPGVTRIDVAYTLAPTPPSP